MKQKSKNDKTPKNRFAHFNHISRNILRISDFMRALM